MHAQGQIYTIGDFQVFLGSTANDSLNFSFLLVSQREKVNRAVLFERNNNSRFLSKLVFRLQYRRKQMRISGGQTGKMNCTQTDEIDAVNTRSNSELPFFAVVVYVCMYACGKVHRCVYVPSS